MVLDERLSLYYRSLRVTPIKPKLTHQFKCSFNNDGVLGRNFRITCRILTMKGPQARVDG